MSSEQATAEKKRHIEELAKGWGKLLAREAFPEGPGLDVDLAAMEELAATGAKALVRGAVETLTGDQAPALGKTPACPKCGKPCELQWRLRRIQVRGGDAELNEPMAHCSTCRRVFFPSASRSEDRGSRL